MQSLGKYIKNFIWECILCSLTASGLAANIYNGFEMNDTLSFIYPAIFGIALILMFGVYMLCFNRISKIVGGCVGVLLIAALVIYAQATHPFNSEETESSGIFIMVLFVSVLICFFVTRAKVGCFILLAFGNVVIAVEVFLQFGLSVPGYIAFLFGSCGLIFSFVFRKLRIQRENEGSLAARYALQIGVIAGVVLAAAAAIVMIFIVPLKLPTQEVKLIQELRSMEVVQKVGVAIFEETIDEDSVSNNEPEDQELSNDQDNNDQDDNDQEDNEPESEEESESQSNPESETQDNPETQAGSGTGENDPGEETAQAIKYDRFDITWIIIAVCVILITAGSIAARKISRREWYKKVCALPRNEGVLKIYPFFIRVLKLVKAGRAGNLTLGEYAKVSRKIVEPFIYGKENFREMTDIYERAYYGGGSVSEEEWKLFADAYEEIYDNVYDEIGKWRYILLFYRI